MKTALTFLLLVSVASADPTRAELETRAQALKTDLQLYPGASQQKSDALTAADQLILRISQLPDPPPPTPGDTLNIVVNSGETLVLEGLVNVEHIHGKPGSTLLVMPGAEVVWADVPLDPSDTEQMGRGLIVEGTIRANGTPRQRVLRFDAPLPAGATSATLRGDPLGWQAGDTLLIPDTRQRANLKNPDTSHQSETVTLTGIAGREITFTPTQYAHGACALDPTLTPHVGNLSCDIVFRSANPSGTRAHTMYLAGATVDVSHCAFLDMGRTKKSERVDPVTNHIGRYPIHLHEMGLTTAKLEGVVIQRSPGWALAFHNTDGALAKDCIGYDIDGSIFVTEAGSEKSSFVDCLAVRAKTTSRGNGKPVGTDKMPSGEFDIAFDGSGFWFRGAGPLVTGCVGADCDFAAFIWSGYGSLQAHVTPGYVDSNEGYACPVGIYRVWSQAGAPGGEAGFYPAEVSRFTGWHLADFGVESWHESKTTYRDIRLLNDPAITAQCNSATNLKTKIPHGVDFQNASYPNGGMLIRNAEIRGFAFGIRGPQNMRGGASFDVRDTVLANWVNVCMHPTFNNNGERVTTLERVTFEPSGITSVLRLPPTETDVWMRWTADSLATRLDPVRLLDIGETVYFKEDAAAPCMTERARIIGYVCEEPE